METDVLAKRVRSYFDLLKKTGHTSVCVPHKLEVLTLLTDMTSGYLSVWKTDKSEEVINRFIHNLC